MNIPIILILLAIGCLILFIFLLQKSFSKESSSSGEEKIIGDKITPSINFTSFYQYDHDYIDDRFNSAQSNIPLTFKKDFRGGLGLLEGVVKIEGGKTIEGEVRLSPYLKVSLVLEILFEQQLIHYYQIKHDYIQSRQKIYEELIEKLQDFEYTFSFITNDMISRQKELIRNFDGNQTVGEFLLREINERPDVTECFIQAHDFEMEGFDSEGNGIMRAVKKNFEDKGPDVVVKLLKETITPRGKSLLQGKGDVVQSLKVFGKVSISRIENLPEIRIIAYVVG